MTMMDFTLENIFVILSFFISWLVMLESFLLEKNGGKLPLDNQPFMIASLMSSAWSVASLLAWWLLSFTGLGLVVVIVYPLYSLLGFIYSTVLIRDAKVLRPEDLVLPVKYLHFCRSFGLVYMLLCLCALAERMGMLQLW
ncbi:hypothetical protein [Moraxella cuniculi]|nr:hypothetical protein [Moraxella cuniculi]